jgi:P22 coat protein - gene protein 5
MPNTILTPVEVTRAALAILHQKLNFVGNIYRGYDDRFARSGAKIGETLTIRLPNEYTVRSGATLSAQDTSETSTTLTVNNQKGVDVNFSSAEMTLSLQDFSDRILDPAMSVLAANIEADALSMYKDVYNFVDGDAAAFTFGSVVDAKTSLTNSLAPNGDRFMVMNTGHANKYIRDRKDAFNPGGDVSKMIRDGLVERAAGFDLYENTLLVPHTTGTAAKTSGYLVNGATQTGATLTVDTGTTSFLKGDVITIAGVFAVHPETKANTGRLQQFVVTANSGTSATSLALSPSIVTSGARQNVSGSPADNAAITKVGAGASETTVESLAFHKNAFTFATADLIMPSGVDFAAREVMDGISMRIVRQYDINNDKFPCRLDVLYGYKTIRPQLAARVHNDG